MPKLELPPSEALYPAPVVLVTSVGKDKNQTNIITIAWCGVVCSRPPLLSISIRPSRHSHKLITETGDFVINIPTSDILRKVDLCGISSGRNMDKFKACSFTKTASSKISSPMIEECPVNIECKLRQTMRLGSHDMFIGEVLAVHIDDDIVNQKGSIDYKKAKGFVYNQGEYWSLGENIGYHGFSAED